MATVTTTANIVGNLVNWTSPSNVGGDISGVPTGRILFTQSPIIPAKGAADTNVLLVNMDLPRNFAYRLETWLVTLRSTNLTGAVATDFEGGMSYRIEQAVPGSGQLFFQALAPMQIISRNTNNFDREFVVDLAGTLFGISGFDRPAEFNDVLIDTRAGSVTPTIQLSLVDQSADTTITATLAVYVSYLQYTVDAVNAWPLNTPTLINGSQ